MNYRDAWNELMSYVPKLSPLMAEKLVQQAWRDIRDSRLWSFLVAETVIETPAAISTGTVTVTQGSNIVLGDITAAAAWDAVPNIQFISRQFRSGAGPVYNIASYATPNITLDRVYAEETATNAAYSIYKCYYTVPTNFLRWTSVIDPIDGYQLFTDRTRETLDHMDPLRGAMSQPMMICSYKYDTVEAPLATTSGHLFELYPHPTIQRTYPAIYQTIGVDFTAPTATFPSQIPDEVVGFRSRYRAYEWAMANGAAHAELRNVNWMVLRADVDKDYQKALFKAQKQDEEIFSQNYVESYLWNRFKRIAFDGNYALNHAPPMYGIYR